MPLVRGKSLGDIQSHPKIDWRTDNWLTEPTTDPTADPTETDPTADPTDPIEPTVRTASRLPLQKTSPKVFERFPKVWFRKVCLCSEGFRKSFQRAPIGFHRFRKVSMKSLFLKVSKGFRRFSKSFRKVS